MVGSVLYEGRDAAVFIDPLLLVSHGEPVLRDGDRALRRCLIQ